MLIYVYLEILYQLIDNKIEYVLTVIFVYRDHINYLKYNKANHSIKLHYKNVPLYKYDIKDIIIIINKNEDHDVAKRLKSVGY